MRQKSKPKVRAPAAPVLERWERLRAAVITARRVLNEEERPSGFGVDMEADYLQMVLDLVVDAAGARWRVPMPDGRYVNEPTRAHHALPVALLRITDFVLRNAATTGNAVAGEAWPVVKAVCVAYKAADRDALTRGTAAQRRDAPTRWANRYLKAKGLNYRANAGEVREALVERFARDYFPGEWGDAQWVEWAVGCMLFHAMLMGGVEPVNHVAPAGLKARILKSFRVHPRDAEDAVERLLKLAGIRDPLNTKKKRERRADLRAT